MRDSEDIASLLPSLIGNPEMMGDAPESELDIDILLPGEEEYSEEEEEEQTGGKLFNLATGKTITNEFLKKLGVSLCEQIEQDKTSCDDWVVKSSAALQYFGLTNTDDIDQAFPGASGDYSLLLSQIVLQYYIQITNTLLNSYNLTHYIIYGEPNEEREKEAESLKAFFNYYLQEIDKDFVKETQKAILWSVLIGTAFKKVYYDDVKEIITSKLIQPDSFIIDWNASSLESAERITEVLRLNKKDFLSLKEKGLFITKDDRMPNFTESDYDFPIQDQVRDLEGRLPLDLELDDDTETEESKVIYTCIVNLNPYDLKEKYGVMLDPKVGLEENKYYSYDVWIDVDTKTIGGIFDNYTIDKKDQVITNKKYVQYGAFTGFGLFSLGVANIIGATNASCTELLRFTKDGLKFASYPSGYYAQGVNFPENSFNMKPGEYQPIDISNIGFPGVKISDVFAGLPYKEPSPHISEFRRELEETAKKMMGMGIINANELNPNMAASTAFALTEDANITKSSVVNNYKLALNNEFEIFKSLFSEYFQEEELTFDGIKESNSIKNSYFSSNTKIVCAGSTDITSKLQKIYQAEAILTKAQAAPGLNNMYEAYKIYYTALNLTDEQINKILPPKEEIPSLDAVSENVRIIKGEPVKAFLYQNHDAHIAIVSQLLNDQTLPPQTLSAAQEHLTQHLAFKYLVNMQSEMGMEIPEDIGEMPPEVQNKISEQAAQVIQSKQQEAQANQPPPPMDPSVAYLEDVKMRGESNMMKAKLEQENIERQRKKDEMSHEIDMMKLQIEQEKLQLESERLASEERFKTEELIIKEETLDFKEAELRLKDIETIELKQNEGEDHD